MNRRSLLSGALATLGVSALPAIEPIRRPGKPRLLLGCAAYGFREYFPYMRDKEVKPREGHEPMDMLRFVDFCADHGADGAELTSYFFPPNVTNAYLLEVRRRAFLRGVAISGTAVGNVWTHPQDSPQRDREIRDTKQWIDRAVVLGTSHVRVFAGSAPKGVSPGDAMKNCVSALRECAEYAGQRGVVLGMENHGGIVAEPESLIEIMRAVDSPWIGVNLDSGNYHTADPYADLAKIAPYAVNVQLKTEIKRQGASDPEPADLPRIIALLREANYQGWVTLEYEAKGDPFTEIPRVLKQLRPLLG